MKVLKQKENGLYDIEYFDKISGQKVRLDDVTEETVSFLKKTKKDEEKYKKQSKRYLCSLDEMQEFGFDIVDDCVDIGHEVVKEEDEEDERRLRNNLYKAIRKLTLRQRQVVRMKFYERKSNKEISEELGLSDARISQLNDQAMAKIRKILKKTRQFLEKTINFYFKTGVIK